MRRRRSLDWGFVLSDHADWPELLRAIDATNAENVWVTHGLRAPLVRWLQEHGRNAVMVEGRRSSPLSVFIRVHPWLTPALRSLS